VIAAVEWNKLGIRNGSGNKSPLFERHNIVVATMKNNRRCSDLWQNISYV
jgi:hypothetical protein